MPPASADQSALPSTPAAAQAPQQSPIYVELSPYASLSSTPNILCLPDGTRSVAKGVKLVFSRYVECKRSYSTEVVWFAEVFYNGSPAYVRNTDLIFETKGDQERAMSFSEAVASANRDAWLASSKDAYRSAARKALAALDAAGKQGIAIVQERVYDTSEHTEGTGFEITFVNTSKKTLKYVTFKVVGINAVGDPVKGRGGIVQTLRGIGPIDPDETAGYEKDYMWFTDVVESARLSSITLEYMDGTKRTISNTKSLYVDPAMYEILVKN